MIGCSSKRDLSAFSTFYSYIENGYLIRPNPFRKKSIPVREEIQKFRKYPKQMKKRIPSIFEIEKICQNINNKSTLFAVNIAYLYGYLPKDILQIYRSKIIFKNRQENELTTDLKKLSKYWLKEIEELKISFSGDPFYLMDKLNTIILDRFRKHTKNMMDNGELEFPYTLTDIKKYFTYDIARIEKVNP